MKNDTITPPEFESFGLNPTLIRAIIDLGFEKPTSIQKQTITPQLTGQDVMGQAQTGTGKTAAYALPLLNNLDTNSRKLQVLVLTPTRELAIQVAKAFEQFAKFMRGVKILPVYGGADMRSQLRALKGGVHIVVGTPGRVMDHMRRGSLKLEELTGIVLDEADEMLNMGFQEDVEWILERAPEERQMSLFSATIPPPIRRIAKRFMHNLCEVSIKTKTSTVSTLNQRYWIVSGLHKLDALSRILEAEEYDGVIVFVRTRAATVKLAEDLINRGFNAAPLNGDIRQFIREQTIDRLKAKRIDILVATDVAARGLDVERISHVINYDIPENAEAYIHRVGRTGRAGRNGEAIIFLSQRERGMLKVIERATRQKITKLELPRTGQINDKRIASFKQKIADVIAKGKLEVNKKIVLEMQVDSDLDPFDIAAAAASMSQGEQPLLLTEKADPIKSKSVHSGSGRKHRENDSGSERHSDPKMTRYRVEVGHLHGVNPGNLLGAIANEAGIEGRDIGKINIRDKFSIIDLPVDMPSEILRELQNVMVSGQQLRISLDSFQFKSRVKSRGGKKPKNSRKRQKPPHLRRARA
ncbi:MAG: DEAD/DEAH box helicase [Candidatus Electryoneaceae bacterium]|nr:DEAD/DEAH box helicase [Candidatus Electryoneaceae bacterium]